MGERRQAGIEVYASQLGLDPAAVPGWFAERFGERFAEEAFNAAAGVWTTGELDPRTRSLLVIAALVAQGGVDERLRGHVRWATKHGCTRAELEEALTLLAPYIGFPRASTALELVRSEFARLDSAG